MGAKGCPTLIIFEGTMITCNQHILVTTYEWINLYVLSYYLN